MDLLSMVNPEMISSWASETFKGSFTQMTLSFTIAAWLHRGWVKKDIKTYFNELTAAINNLGVSLKQEFKSELNQLNARVESLEKKQADK